MLICTAFGQTARKFSNEFLNIGVDAAALGMSNAVVAHIDHVNAAYWNPAGLANIEDQEISLMHANYFASIANYDYAAFAMPLDDRSAVAFSLIRFGVDDILNTTELIDNEGNIDFNRISLFSATDWAFMFSYARSAPVQGLKYGANAKVVRRIIGDFATSWGFGFDLGIQYEAGKWQLGLMLRDITTTVNTWTFDEEEFQKIRDAIPGQNQDVPESTEVTLPKAQFGVSRMFELGRDYELLAEIDLNARFFETNDVISSSFVSVDPAFGFQLDYLDMVFLRGGVGNFQNIEQFDGSEELNVQPNFGVGFRYRGIQFDYALTNIGEGGEALVSNVFSLRVDLSIFR
ncbi:MAG: PorV/PorQ family protein [Flavobacteriaceae bacterium]|nr:PorV/PorQ family protein [Flavobacteriaceae bacterium]